MAAPPTLTVLHSFSGSPGDGATPWATLAIDANGALYGTTRQGGAFGKGTVFELAPPATGGAWSETILHSFSGQNGDGADPIAGLVLGGGGELYGATSGGGSFGKGAVFQLTPPAAAGAAWTETVLHSFDGTDGANPQTGVILTPDGTLYVAAQSGGSANFGTVFALTPGATGGAWTGTVLHSFTGPPGDGAYPSGLLLASSGKLYGTTLNGGLDDNGAAFELTPPTATGGAWSKSILYSFSGSPGDGAFPIGGLVFGDHGEFFGTAEYGGNGGYYGGGAVFVISPPTHAGRPWTEGLPWSFPGDAAEGALPTSGVAITSLGVLYGTTSIGGSSTSCAAGCGTIFQLLPPTSPGAYWTQHTLVNFGGGSAGRFPMGGLAMDPQGTLYGATSGGGASGYGAVYQLTR